MEIIEAGIVDNRIQLALVNGKHSIPVYIPDVNGLQIPSEARTDLHNELAKRRIIIYDDLVRCDGCVTAILAKVSRKHDISQQTANQVRRQLVKMYQLNRR